MICSFRFRIVRSTRSLHGSPRNSAVFNQQSNDLERELDTFFERAAESGSEAVRKLTAAERAERAIRGGEIEDEIFDLRFQILQAEDDVMNGKDGADGIEKLRTMRDRMNNLKTEYRNVVGATDLPIYFGKIPDSMQ
jgi:hypothetical protein